ncbi:hypothetical protein [Winogradskyella sp. MIT101101]|uniref:hypothetical protein n=1 Tax=Winogradskyella sp. MIT101101 TaxID=3098297 RepID=UPI00399C2B8A
MTKKKELRKKIDLYREAIILHYTESYKSETYSRQRIDVVTIALSTGGIILGLSILKFIYEQKIVINTALLKISIVAFAITIIVNYVNQHVAAKAHNLERKWARKEDEIIKYELTEDNEYKLNKSDNKIIISLNIINMLLLIISMVLISIFILTTF